MDNEITNFSISLCVRIGVIRAYIYLKYISQMRFFKKESDHIRHTMWHHKIWHALSDVQQNIVLCALQIMTLSAVHSFKTSYLSTRQHDITRSNRYLSVHRAKPMLHVTFWLQLLVIILILRQSGSLSDHCIKFLDTISRFERHMSQRIAELEEMNITLESPNYVSYRQYDTAI
jgi:hypothetical protein